MVDAGQTMNKHFSWDKLVADRDPKDFLVKPELWGTGQGPENDSRQFFKSVVRKLAKRKIELLEVGFGSGIDFSIIKKDIGLENILYHGADVTKAFVESAKENLQGLIPVLADAKTLPYVGELFDLVYTRHTLEHQNDYRPLLAEIFRVTKVYALVVLFIPLTNKEYDFLEFDGTWFHNHYSYPMFVDFAAAHGFELYKKEAWTKFFDREKYSEEAYLLRRV